MKFTLCRKPFVTLRRATSTAALAAGLMLMAHPTSATIATTGIVLGENSNIVMPGVVGQPLVGGTTVNADNLNYFSGSVIAGCVATLKIPTENAPRATRLRGLRQLSRTAGR